MTENNYTRKLHELESGGIENSQKIEQIKRLRLNIGEINDVLKEEYDKKIEIDIYHYIKLHCREKPEELDNLVTNHTLKELANRNIRNLKQRLYACNVGLFASIDSTASIVFEMNVSELGTYYTDYLRYAKLRRERSIAHEETGLELAVLETAQLFIELYCPQNLPPKELLSESPLSPEYEKSKLIN